MTDPMVQAILDLKDRIKTPVEGDNPLIVRIKLFLAILAYTKLLKKQLETATQEKERWEAEVFTLMFNEDIQNLKIDDKLVYRKVEPYPSILEEKDFFEFLEETGNDGIIKRTIHPKTLKGWYDSYIELNKDNEEAIAELEPLLKVFEKKSVGVRKA